MNIVMRPRDAGPWYREPWPWLLMAGPAAAIVAGFFTYWLSVSSYDGVVADDYYKQGLAINQTLQRSNNAQRLGLIAKVRYERAARRFAVEIQGSDLPAELRLTLAHPTRAMADEVIGLRLEGGGKYSGSTAAAHGGRRVLILEDKARSWRLTGDVVVDSEAVFELIPQ